MEGEAVTRRRLKNTADIYGRPEGYTAIRVPALSVVMNVIITLPATSWCKTWIAGSRIL